MRGELSVTRGATPSREPGASGALGALEELASLEEGFWLGVDLVCASFPGVLDGSTGAAEEAEEAEGAVGAFAGGVGGVGGVAGVVGGTGVAGGAGVAGVAGGTGLLLGTFDDLTMTVSCR